MARPLKILYVTPMWSGLRRMIETGDLEITGMPAFFYPLKTLARRGDQIELVIGDVKASRQYNIDFFPIENVTKATVFPWRRGAYLLADALSIQFALFGRLRKNRYDFVYCHGSFGALGSCAARLFDVPVGHRLYGTFLARKINQSLLQIFMQHPLEYFSYRSKKKFLLMTNDGTQGNVVYEKLGKPKLQEFYYLLNGVDRPPIRCESPFSNHHISNLERTLIYPARIAKWKRQDRALKLLSYLRKESCYNLRLSFYGSITDQVYYKRLIDLACELGVSDAVRFYDAVGYEELAYLYRNSLAVLSLYDYSNLGNVLIEAMVNGALIVSMRDGSLEGIIAHGHNGILLDDEKTGASLVSQYLTDASARTTLKTNAETSGRRIFSSWDERADKEVNIIDRAVFE